MREVRVVWALLAADALAVVVTYSRLPANELYNVHSSGLRGGLSRLVVEVNFPDALIALAILGVIAPTLAPALRWVAAAAAVLCAYAVLPGVVQQSNLGAKWENAIPAAGVALALALTFLARRPPPSRARGDRVRVAVGAVLVVLAAPWIAAVLGFYLDGVPVLGRLFQTGRMASFHDPLHHTVHHGVHHGLQGLLFALTAVILSRVPNRISFYLALLVAFGAANMLNDGWLEQVVERGWSSHPVPSVLGFSVNWLWGATLAVAAAIWVVARDGRPARRRPRTAAPPS
jgi:hypothetical protein